MVHLLSFSSFFKTRHLLETSALPIYLLGPPSGPIGLHQFFPTPPTYPPKNPALTKWLPLSSNHFRKCPQISDTSGKTDVEIDLSREVALADDDGDSISINVEVTDEARRTYETMATVRVEKQMVKLEFDHTRTDLVYHTRMPYRAVVSRRCSCNT